MIGYADKKSFAKANSNLKLKILGQSFIAMTFRIRIYDETSGLPNIESKSNEKIEE
jgi:hypothetical protein